MLLTISTTLSPATDLGYLLYKNPARVQAFDPNVSNLPNELNPVRLCADPRAVASGADALVVGNESPVEVLRVGFVHVQYVRFHMWPS